MPADAPLSVLLLVRDETEALARLLPRLAFAAEVVVVWDPRGAPATRDLAARLGAIVHEREMTGGFGAQRQFALERCTQPAVLWIDVDEWPDDALVESIRELAARGEGPCVGEVLRATWFLGARIRHCGWDREWLPRVFTRVGARFGAETIHERLTPPAGATRVRCRGQLEHHSYPTWEACTTKLVRYAAAGADAAWQRGRRASRLDVLLRPPARFLRMYVFQAGFLDGGRGLLVCLLAAAQVFLKFGELWSRSRAERQGR